MKDNTIVSKTILVFSIIFALFLQPGLVGQVAWDFSDEDVISRLKQDVYTLAGEEMEGREAGTEGERKAAAYIRERMQEVGLEPAFEGSFYQEFPFPGDWVWGADNLFTYGENSFEHGVDYHVLPGSAATTLTSAFVHVGYGLSAFDDLENYEDHCDYALHSDVDGLFYVMEYHLPEALDGVGDRRAFQLLFRRINTAVEKGAAGIVFVNTRDDRDDPPIDLRMGRGGFEIPILFAGQEVLHLMMSDQDHELYIVSDIDRLELTGINVAGYIDHGAETTVVIGAHYDHIGFGGRGSRSPGIHAIHPGADDNASGTAGMLEAARYIYTSTLTGHNYLFMAFSAEEKGLIGSRYFTDSDAYDMEKIQYMFNLDMIGRMEDNSLALIGTGTSPRWDELIDEHAPGHFDISRRPGGRGGSDHTAFYLKEIPVLFFFTGVHDDYHRPEDTADKVNYQGAMEITRFALDMVRTLDGVESLPFSQSSSSQEERPRTRTVAFGLMPDHAFEGQGLRVLSVSDDQPAQRAGMQNGDVIIQINDMEISEIYTYMEALGNLSSGQSARVLVIRDGEEHSLELLL